jgi:hypothetical protein
VSLVRRSTLRISLAARLALSAGDRWRQDWLFAVKVLLVDGTEEVTTTLTTGALRFQRTGIAGSSIRSVDEDLFPCPP